MGLARMLGLLLLIASIALYLYIGYYVTPKDLYDDKVTWYHIHIIKYISGGGNPSSDRYLNYIYGKDLYRSPIMLDHIVSCMKFSDVGILTIVCGILTILVVFMVTYIMFRDVLASGIACVIVSATPSFMYWFKYNNYGPYILSFMLIIFYILFNGSVRRCVYCIVLSLLILTITIIFIPSAWLALIVIALYILALIYRGSVEKIHLAVAALVALVTLVLMPIAKHYTVMHFISLILLVIVLCGAASFHEFKGSTLARNVWRIALIPLLLAASIIVSNVVLQYYTPMGLPEPYSKDYMPISDMLPIVILSPLAIYLALKRGYVIERNPLPFLMAASFIVTLVMACYERSLEIVAVMTIAPLIGIGLREVSLIVSLYSPRKYRLLSKTALAWSIIALILGGYYGGLAVVTAPQQIYFMGPIPHHYRLPEFNKTGLPTVINLINESNAVVIAPWDNGIWITGLKDVYVLGDDHSDPTVKRLISQIFSCDETTARGIILRNINVTEHPIYVIVSSIVSIERFGERTYSRYAHIGRVYLIRGATASPTPIYIPEGDLAKLMDYVKLSGHNVNDYFNLNSIRMRARLQQPLAWREKALKTLLVQLIVNAINKLGKTPINDVYSSIPIMPHDVPEPKFFKLVNATMIKIESLEAGYRSYDIFMIIALYRFTP